MRSAQSARSVVTMPPSPVVMFFTAWKLKAGEIGGGADASRSAAAAPNACAASSIDRQAVPRGDAAEARQRRRPSREVHRQERRACAA